MWKESENYHGLKSSQNGKGSDHPGADVCKEYLKLPVSTVTTELPVSSTVTTQDTHRVPQISTGWQRSFPLRLGLLCVILTSGIESKMQTPTKEYID